MTLEIVIDELVVRGLAPEEARLVAAALETRLTELASADRGVPAREEAYRRATPVEAPADAPAAVGEAVAGTVWKSVTGERR